MSTSTVYLTVGLPGSGKSTWGVSFARDIGAVEVTKDKLRTQVCQNMSRGKIESAVITKQEMIVRIALSAGKSVVVHDTNFNPFHLDRLSALAAEYGADVETVDFTHVPVEECVRRDAQREASVGREVIESMYRQYLARA